MNTATKKIKVSVIIPVYNGERTIKRCVDSVAAQTLCDIEIIIIDDGSTDNTASVISDIADSRIRTVTIPNGGQGFARNLGIDMAEGEYLAFVDADDTTEKNMLSSMYMAAKKSGADVVQCDIYDVYQNGEKRVQLGSENKTVCICDRGLYTDMFFTPCRHSYEVCNKLIKKSVLDGLRFMDTRTYFSEDLLFNLYLIEKISKITFLSAPYYNYYQSADSHLHTGADKKLKGIRALFRDYIQQADEPMKSAAAYTAAMVIAYTAGEAAECDGARELLSCAEYTSYVKKALRRRCRTVHRAFLTAMLAAPANVRLQLAKKYAGRYKNQC